ncbi:hypothetical protein [Microbacterium sp. H83]|uniref:hypothetical protein n=1 Tax=Microbacterium sp. H83 TaxID=1827324 RepID=UPI0007F39E7E|nr:hypothetical protein [Microbacterium sp. H83]OAN33036.1 hypothetical protein A4X16_07465 [Microbacterium sp. H83]
MDHAPLQGFSRAYAAAAAASLGDRPRDEAEQHIVECLKLLVLRAGQPGLPIAVSPEIESVHAALAEHPSSHRRTCARLPEGRLPSGPAPRRDPTPDESARLVALYVQSFGPFTPRSVRLWPAARVVMAALGVGLSGLNDAGAGWDAGWALPADSPWRRLGGVLRISELL